MNNEINTLRNEIVEKTNLLRNLTKDALDKKFIITKQYYEYHDTYYITLYRPLLPGEYAVHLGHIEIYNNYIFNRKYKEVSSRFVEKHDHSIIRHDCIVHMIECKETALRTFKKEVEEVFLKDIKDSADYIKEKNNEYLYPY